MRNMDSRKPLMAGEIEDARGKLSKISQGTWKSFPKEKYNEWHLSAPIEGSTWTFGIFPDGFPRCVDGSDLGQEYVEAIAAAMNIVPRLLSLLPPPPDAAVREAVEAGRECLRVGGWGFLFNADHLDTLLRAVQSPRLTPEQVDAVKWAERFIQEHGGKAAAWADERYSQTEGEEIDEDMDAGLESLRAAFPEAFAGEE